RIRESMPPQVYASLKSVQSLSSPVSATLTSNSELRKFSQKAQSKSTQKQELIGWFACIYLIGVAVSISALLVEVAIFRLGRKVQNDTSKKSGHFGNYLSCNSKLDDAKPQKASNRIRFGAMYFLEIG